PSPTMGPSSLPARTSSNPSSADNSCDFSLSKNVVGHRSFIVGRPRGKTPSRFFLANDERPTTNDWFTGPWPLAPAFLVRHLHFVVREIRPLHHRSPELHHHLLLCQRAGQPELEHSRIRIGQPVILDQVLG